LVLVAIVLIALVIAALVLTHEGGSRGITRLF
jgi:preprotein translocase subunit SecG